MQSLWEAPEPWFGVWPQHHSAQHLGAVKSWVCLMCKLCAAGCEGKGTASTLFIFVYDVGSVLAGTLVCWWSTFYERLKTRNHSVLCYFERNYLVVFRFVRCTVLYSNQNSVFENYAKSQLVIWYGCLKPAKKIRTFPNTHLIFHCWCFHCLLLFAPGEIQTRQWTAHKLIKPLSKFYK